MSKCYEVNNPHHHSYDLGIVYEVSPVSGCTNYSVEGTIPNPWAFLVNATYNGTADYEGLSDFIGNVQFNYGMAWHGMVWYGMVWYGMVWYIAYRVWLLPFDFKLVST